MFLNLSTHIADTLAKEQIIKQTEEEIYRYGLKMLFIYALNILTAFIIAILMGRLWECLILEVVFIPLRSYAGGYHAPSEIKCYILSVGMMILDFLLLSFCLKNFDNNIGLLILIICVLIIAFFAPVDNKNKPLDADERRVYRHRTNIILLIEVLIATLCAIFSQNTMFWVIVIGISSVAFSLIVGEYTNKLNFR